MLCVNFNDFFQLVFINNKGNNRIYNTNESE